MKRSTVLSVLILVMIMVMACGGDGMAGGSRIGPVEVTMTSCNWGPHGVLAFAREPKYLNIYVSLNNNSNQSQYIKYAVQDSGGKTYSPLRTTPLAPGERIFDTVVTAEFPVGSRDLKLIVTQVGGAAKTLDLRGCSSPTSSGGTPATTALPVTARITTPPSGPSPTTATTATERLPLGSYVVDRSGSKDRGTYRGQMHLLTVDIRENSMRVQSQLSVKYARTQGVAFSPVSCVGGRFTYLTDNLGNKYVADGCGGALAGGPILSSGQTYAGYIDFQGRPPAGTHTFTYHSWFSSPIEFTLASDGTQSTSPPTPAPMDVAEPVGLKLKLPLPGNNSWLLTVEAGGKVTPLIGGGVDEFHTDSKNGFYALDFDDLTRQDGPLVDVPVLAAADGTVVAVQRYPTGFGNFVRLDHGGGYTTLYAHMSDRSVTVQVGQQVTNGQKLGIVGTTGLSSGTHLHFEVEYQGQSRSDISAFDAVLLEGRKISEFKVEPAPQYYMSTNSQ